MDIGKPVREGVVIPIPVRREVTEPEKPVRKPVRVPEKEPA